MEGPALVPAEAQQRRCAVSEVPISRRTAPDLVGTLGSVLPRGIPVVETSVADLDAVAGTRAHGGVVALLNGRRAPARGPAEVGLATVIGLSLPA